MLAAMTCLQPLVFLSYITTGYPVVNHSSNHDGSHTDGDDGAGRYLGSSRMQDTPEQKRPLPRIAMLGNR